MNINHNRDSSKEQMSQITRMSFVTVLVTLGLALGARAAEDAGPAVPDRAALDREMTELNGRIDQSAQAIPASGQLVVFSNGWDRTVQQFASGGRLMIGSKTFVSKTYDHGLYCIAPSRIAVRLPSQGDTFEAVVGVDVNQINQGWRRALPGFQGQLVFSVTVDGRPVFKSAELSRQSEGVPVRVKLEGSREFTIEVVAPGSVRHIAWADWAEAVVTLTDGQQLPLAKMDMKQPEERWKRVDAVIEWGFQEGFENRAYDGRVEVTSDSGKAGVVEPLPGSTAATDASSWRSQPSGSERRGVVVPLLYTDAVRGTNRTIVTVRTASGSFSFQPVDLAGGPILVPELGFFVADVATRTTAREFCAQLQAKGLQTIRQQARQQPEQSWEEAMRALRGSDFRLPALEIQERKGWLPFHEPSMSVEVPDPYLSYLWRTGAWGITRYFKLIDRAEIQKFGTGNKRIRAIENPGGPDAFDLATGAGRPPAIKADRGIQALDQLMDRADVQESGKDDKGTGAIEKPEAPRAFYLLTGVWQPLAQEVDRITLALDQMGMHRIARDCLALWLENQRADGALALNLGTERRHAIGQLIIPWVMVEHYRLTGDKEWLKAQAPRLKAAADWIIARRRSTMKNTLTPEEQRRIQRGQQRPGLLPPSSTGDGDGSGKFWFIVADASGYQSLRLLADVLTEVDPRMGAELSVEAEQYLKALKSALEEAIVLSPVMKVRDGTYRRFLPPGFAARGPRSVESPQGSDVYTHWGPFMHDLSFTSMPIEFFLRSGVMNVGDPFLDGHFDVLEDVFFFDHPWYYIRKPDYDPQRDWFHVGGWGYQSPYERLPEYYLAKDDIPNFLRSWQNRCVADMYFQGDPFGDADKTDYMFKEHTWFNVYDKQQNRGAFQSNFRNMLVMEIGDVLWLARATPRAWLEQGRKIAVKNAPTHFGTVAYEIVSDVDNGKITATVELPSRKAPQEVVLRFRHPKAAPIKAVTVNGKSWTEFNRDKETVALKGLTGTVTVTAQWAVLSAQPGDLSFALASATGQVAPRQVAITYRGGPGTDSPFTISAADPWVKIAAGSGAGHGQTFAVSVDPTGLPLAGHSSKVMVSRSDIPETLVLPVRLRLGAPAPKVMTIRPTAGRCPPNGELRFTLAAQDQFGDPFLAEVRWSVSGGGAISPQGVFTSDGAGGDFTVTAAVQGNPAATATAQLKVLPVNVAHWKLDEKSGTVAADAWGNFQGTLVGGPTWEPGKRGGALRLNGNQYVDTGWNLDGLLLPCSFAFWVNPAATQGTNANIFGNHGGSTVGVVMQQEGATLNRYSFIYGSSPVAGSAGPVQLTANEWQHVAIVCDGKEVVIYLNGKETARGKGENPITPNPSLNFRLGTGFSGGRFFNGALDDFRIYGRALSVEEINRLMTAQDGQ